MKCAIELKTTAPAVIAAIAAYAAKDIHVRQSMNRRHWIVTW
jgi:hypothetical protein